MNGELLTRVLFCYCLSYTALFVAPLPLAPASLVLITRDLPSPDTMIRSVTVTFPSTSLVRNTFRK
jgi:hypothetical protein